MTTGINLMELAAELEPPGSFPRSRAKPLQDVFTDARIVIVDDQRSNLKALEAVLLDGIAVMKALS